jgi:hypothetical protein
LLPRQWLGASGITSKKIDASKQANTNVKNSWLGCGA